jgi:hypothetical protein
MFKTVKKEKKGVFPIYLFPSENIRGVATFGLVP